MSEAVSEIIQSPLTWEGDRAPLAKALVVAQKATESIKKAASNPHFKSKYADLSEVVEGVVPALNDAGVAVLQVPTAQGAQVSVTTVFLHESGSSVSGTLTMTATKNDPQGVGSAITYARRYALLAMSGAAPVDDDGNAASKPVPKVTPDQAKVIDDLLRQSDTAPKVVLQYCNVSTLADIPAAAFNEVKAKLEARLPQKEAA